MNLIRVCLISIFYNIYAVSDKIIINREKPICKNCAYYVPYKFPKIEGDKFKLAKCVKFGEKNIITGKIKYDHVDACRKNETKCGENGKYFIEKHKHIWFEQ